MITIINISDTKFSYNGINYFKNFTPFVTGNKVSIVNTYDACISLTNFPTIYSDISVDGVTYGSIAALQNALLPVLFNRTFSQSGSLTAGYIPKATGSNILGNSLIYDNGSGIGINTTTPLSAFTVNGNLSLFTTNQIRLYNSAKNNWAEMSSPLLGGDTEIDFKLVTKSGIIYVNPTGNIAIGSTAPNYLATNRRVLDINGATQSMLALSVGGVGKSFLFYTGTDLLISNESNGAIKFNTNGSQKVIIEAGGNVGVGTNTPTQKVTIGDGTGTGNQYLRINSSSTDIYIGQSGSGLFGLAANSAGNIASDNTSNPLAIGTIASQPFIFGTANAERMRISLGGSVSIGTTSSIGKFLIQGNTSNSADYSMILKNSNSSDLVSFRNDGLVTFPFVVSSWTTGNAANAWLNPSTGDLYRSTSSIKYKKNVKDYTRGLEDVMKLRPVTYEGKEDIDNGKTFAGLIAEEVHNLGLTEFVQYAEDGSPDALAYQNMIALAFKAIQELKSEIQILKN